MVANLVLPRRVSIYMERQINIYSNIYTYILEVGHQGIWSRDIKFWGTVLGINLHFLRKIRFFNLMSRTY